MARVKGLAAKLAAQNFERAFKKKGYKFFKSGNYNLNVIGVRNSSGNASKFDDFINLLYKIKGRWVWDCYEITTEPGWKILKNPIVDKGTAILVPDQYRGAYKIALHRGAYPALCQLGGPVKVWRDNNRDDIPDYHGPEEEGWFGINIHKHRGSGARVNTGGVSAGCQVFQNSRDFHEFMETCEIASEAWGNHFTYTLLEERDLKKGGLDYDIV